MAGYIFSTVFKMPLRTIATEKHFLTLLKAIEKLLGVIYAML
jgi:hypothetical protein